MSAPTPLPSSAASQEGSAQPVTLRVKIGSVRSDNPDCNGVGERGADVPVVVENEDGRILASGATASRTTRVATSEPESDGSYAQGCLFPFSADVPAAEQYRVIVDGEYEFVFPRTTAETSDLRLLIDYDGGKLVAYPPVNGLLDFNE